MISVKLALKHCGWCRSTAPCVHRRLRILRRMLRMLWVWWRWTWRVHSRRSSSHPLWCTLGMRMTATSGVQWLIVMVLINTAASADNIAVVSNHWMLVCELNHARVLHGNNVTHFARVHQRRIPPYRYRFVSTIVFLNDQTTHINMHTREVGEPNLVTYRSSAYLSNTKGTPGIGDGTWCRRPSDITPGLPWFRK